MKARAVPHLLEILDVTERIGARAWKTRVLNTIGWCFSELGAHELAINFNERASLLSEEVGDPEIIANSKINLALIFLDQDPCPGAFGPRAGPIRGGTHAGR